MFIKQCKGYELEKAKPNTSEDFFNQSEVTFIEDGSEKTLHVLYVRYFDEQIEEFTPFKEDPIFEVNGRSICFKEIVALICLIKNPSNRKRKRVYINSISEFASIFQDIDYEKLKSIFQGLDGGTGYELKSPLEFIAQPS
ncbi:hypothetical protein [Bacillus dakarensis]|uniref:hypothetical protein n=1 Tax=Robertmurraya dakarensis TaxID=1926278 RepID=UPI00098248A8|nr:hypothetical protein [Bacillus dakarensis]